MKNVEITSSTEAYEYLLKLIKDASEKGKNWLFFSEDMTEYNIYEFTDSEGRRCVGIGPIDGGGYGSHVKIHFDQNEFDKKENKVALKDGKLFLKDSGLSVTIIVYKPSKLEI